MILIQRLLPEAHFIHLVRDGRDAALSYRGLWFGPGDDIEVQARFWRDQILSARAQARDLMHYLEVKYEALVVQPEQTLRGICDYLALPYTPAMLDYHRSAATRLAEFRRPFGPPGVQPPDRARFLAIHDHTTRPPDPARAGRWRSEMPDSDQRKYEAIAGKLLRQFGYSTRFTG